MVVFFRIKKNNGTSYLVASLKNTIGKLKECDTKRVN